MGAFTPQFEYTDEQKWAQLPAVPAVVPITPEMARNWLDTRAHPEVVHNRRRSEATAKKYALQMALGHWRLHHQGIAFDTDGNLVDGQHRLMAITYARDMVRGAHRVQKPDANQEQMRKAWPDGADGPSLVVPMLVTPNVPRDTFAYMDQGLKRGAAQLYAASNATAVAAAARWLFPGRIGIYNREATTAEVLDVIDAWGELGTYSAAVVKVRNTVGMSPGHHLAVVAQAARTVHHEDISSWLHGLITGNELNSDQGLKGGDPRRQVREKFMADSRGINRDRDLAYNLIAKAWNRHVTGERRQGLAWRENEGRIPVFGYEEKGDGRAGG